MGFRKIKNLLKLDHQNWNSGLSNMQCTCVQYSCSVYTYWHQSLYGPPHRTRQLPAPQITHYWSPGVFCEPQTSQQHWGMWCVGGVCESMCIGVFIPTCPPPEARGSAPQCCVQVYDQRDRKTACLLTHTDTQWVCQLTDDDQQSWHTPQGCGLVYPAARDWHHALPAAPPAWPGQLGLPHGGGYSHAPNRDK